MSLIDELNERKKKIQGTTAGATTSGGLMAEINMRKKYRSLPTDDVDDKYVQTFVSDANSFISDVGSNELSYADATSRLDDLTSRYDTVSAWLYKNKSKLDEKSYNSISTALGELKIGFDSINKYYSQWESDEDYNKYLMGWLNTEATTDEKNSAQRKGQYKSNTERISEIDKELPFYAGSSWVPNFAENWFLSDEQEATRNELEKRKAENKQYERTQKAVDDYYVPVTDEFLKNASYRDYKNASREELRNYNVSEREGSLALNSGGYFDDEGNIRDSKGNIVQYANAPMVEDKLGLFLSTTEDEITEAYNELTLASSGNYSNTWAEMVKEGDINGWSYLTENEVNIYYDLYKREGQESAYRYLDAMTTELTRRATQETTDYINNAEGLEQVFLNAASIPMNVFGGAFSFVDDAANVLKGEDINPYSRAHAFQNAATDIRSKTAADVDKWTGNVAIPFIDFSVGDTYQALMSGADSMLGVAMGGNAYGVLMGMGAASSTAKDLYTKGATTEQIVAGSLLAGAAEMVFEKVSIDKLVKGADAKSIKNIVVNMLTQSGVEATEEMATEIANTITNYIVMGEQSDWVDMETFVKNVVNAGLGGFISGGGMAGIYSTAQKVVYDKQVKEYGKSIIDQGGVEGLRETASKLTENKAVAKLINKVAKNTSAKNVGRLAATVQNVTDTNDKVNMVSELVDKGLSKREAAKVANFVTELSHGYEPSYNEIAEIEKITDKLPDVVDTTAEPATIRDFRTVEAVQPTEETAQAPAVATLETARQTGIDAEPESVPAEENATEAKTTAFEDAEKNTVSLEKISKQYGAQAAAVVSTYTKGQDVAKYDAAYRAAYDMGNSGVNLSYAMNSELTSYLTESQRKLAYAAGADASNATAREQDAANKAKANGNTGRRKGAVRGDAVTVADIKTAVNDKQGTAYKLLSTYAEATGIDIVLYKSSVNADGEFEGAQGKFKWSENTIYIDINAGLANVNDVNELAKYTMLRTFAHEFTHFIEKWNPIQYNEFRKVVFDTLTERGENVDELITAKMARSEGMTYEEASRETVAEAMTDILLNANFVEELATNHKTIFNKLLEKLKEFVSELKVYFNSLLSNRSREANALKEQVGESVRYVESIVKLFDKIAVEAVENYQMTVAVEEATVSKTEQVEETVTETAETVTEKTETVVEEETTVAKQSVEEVEKEYKKKFSPWLKRAFKKYAMRYNGVAYISDGSFGLRATDELLGWARSEFVGEIYETALPEPATNALNNANALMTEAPLEGTLGDKTVYVFNLDGENAVFDKKYLSKLDGNLFYIGDFTKGAKILKAVDANGDVVGFLLPLKVVSDITNTKPSKLKSFSSKMQTIIDSQKSATETIPETTDTMSAENLEAETVFDTVSEKLADNLVRNTVDDTVQEQSRAYLGHNKYSYEWFANKPDMAVTTLDSQIPTSRADVINEAKKNAASVGSVNEDGSVSVYVNDIGADVILSKKGLAHGLDRRFKEIAPITLQAGKIIHNSIKINELTPSKEDADASYVLIGVAKNSNGDLYIVRSVVNKFSSELTTMDVLYAISAKKSTAALNAPLVSTPDYRTDISVAQLLEYVNRYFPDILPESVLKHFGHEARPDGLLGKDILYQQRTTTLTDREVLAMAADKLAESKLSEAERDALQIFQSRLSRLEGLQIDRAEAGSLYKEQQFGANVDRSAAAQTLNRMRVLDEQIKKAEAEVLSIENKKVFGEVLKKARKVVETEQRAHDAELVKRWRDRTQNAAAIKKYRERIRTDVNELTNWALKPNNKDIVKHIPDVLKNSVIPFLSSIDFTSKQQLRGGEATKADKEFIKRLNGLKSALKQNIDVNGLYSGYNDLPANFMEKLQTLIDAVQAITEKKSGEFVINQMTSEELKELSNVVRVIKAYITQINKFHANAMFQHVYEAGDSTIDSLSVMESDNGKSGTASNFVFWQQIRPAFAFERFGSGGIAIYDGLRRGQAKLAFNAKKIVDFTEKAYTEAEVKTWEKEIKQINLGGDIVVKMPVSMVMSFYELSKQPDSLRHMLGEGFRVATYTNKGKKISDNGHTLTNENISTIINELTPRQKEVADALQKFMAEQGGAWGNYVSVKRFGEELFTNEQYFPINSDGRHLQATADEQPSAASLYALLNMSFTKSRNELANNRIIVYSIFDVFANHMSSMAQYNAMALPVLDAIKWFNYQQKTEDHEGNKYVKDGVREQMARVYGVSEETRPGAGNKGYAENFVLNILKAFNGTEAQGISTDNVGMNALRNYNMAQIAFNFRVVVQQPLAVTRAALLVDYDSIVKGMNLKPSAIKQNVEEMRKYSGIAAWKSLGFYDVNISRGLTDTIKHNSDWKQKVGEIGMKGAEYADTITWAVIWSACKEEVIKKQRLAPKSEGFYEAVTELFEDVVYKTQVVDSILTKNEYLRSKGLFARLTSSFMSEPTTTASMLIDTVDKYNADLKRGMTRQQAWEKNKRMIGRVMYVYGVSAVILAAVQAVADAIRDDDDHETFIEKWLEAFGGNLIDELMPFNKLPLLSDFYDLAKELLSLFGVDTYGNPPQSVFMQWYDSLVKGFEILYDRISGEDTNYTWYGGIYKLLQATSGMTGLPMASATREAITAWNNIVGAMAPSLKVKTYDSGEQNEIKYAYADGYLTFEEAVNALVEQGLVDNEDEAYFTVQGWEVGEGYSRYGALENAVRNGTGVDEAMYELTSHGYTEDKIYSHIRSKTGEWYKGGEISKAQATDILGKYTDMDRDEITEYVNKWSSFVVTGIEYDDIDEEFMAGNITASRAIEMYARYGSMTQEKATEKVAVLSFVKEYPECEGISYTAVKAYTQYCEPYGIEAGTFYDVWQYKSSISADVDADGKAISGSKKSKVLAYVNSLALSARGKDSLYYALGYAESTIDEAPWR